MKGLYPLINEMPNKMKLIMLKRILVLSAVLLNSKSTFSQSSPTDISTAFFNIYKKPDIDSAINYLFATNKYSVQFQESLDEVKRSLKKSTSMAGSFLGYEQLSKKTAGQNLVFLTFIILYERQPFTFRILFYKLKDKWQVQNFNFDSKIDDELEEASKAYRLRENFDN